MRIRQVWWCLSVFALVCACETDASGESDAGATGDAGRRGDGSVVREDGGALPVGEAAGLFITRAQLERARERGTAVSSPFAAQYRQVESRATTAMGVSANPFHMDDVSTIRFGWSEPSGGPDDTLSEASRKFETDGNHIRNLALWFALSGDTTRADHALEMMLTLAREQTIVNMHDLNVDYAAGTFDGITDGFSSDRPWNFGLDAIWQAYGLMGAADAYLLLTRNGYALSAEDDSALRDWIRRLVEGVNSAFHCWTRWADAHTGSGSFVRYRSDNHLSWAMTGLIAGAAALGDAQLGAYVIEGGEWTDSRGGAYSNPSSIRAVIDLAIESGTGDENEGRVFEEQILRDPPIGYSFFHLWAMSVIARAAEVHFGADVWSMRGADGAGLELAFERYAAFVLGERASPRPDQDGDLSDQRWLFEMPSAHYGSSRFAEVLAAGGRDAYILQSIGPVWLLLGE